MLSCSDICAGLVRSRLKLAASLILLGATGGLSPVASQARCGFERWSVKIGADRDIQLVDTVPTPTTVSELAGLSRPNSDFPQDARVSPVEFKSFLLRARLVRVIAEDDSDLHLVLRDLEDERSTIVAEIPHPECSSNDTFALNFAAARQALRGVGRDGIVEIVGFGFFDFMHGQSGMAPNGIEIHPVLYLRAIHD